MFVVMPRKGSFGGPNIEPYFSNYRHLISGNWNFATMTERLNRFIKIFSFRWHSFFAPKAPWHKGFLAVWKKNLPTYLAHINRMPLSLHPLLKKRFRPCPATFLHKSNKRSLGRVARQRSAKPSTAVRIRQRPPKRVKQGSLHTALCLTLFVLARFFCVQFTSIFKKNKKNSTHSQRFWFLWRPYVKCFVKSNLTQTWHNKKPLSLGTRRAGSVVRASSFLSLHTKIL